MRFPLPPFHPPPSHPLTPLHFRPDLLRPYHLRLAVAADGVGEVRSRRCRRSDITLRVEGQERRLRRVNAAADGDRVHPPARRLARLLRRLPGPHLLDDEEAAAGPDDLLAD